MQTVELFTTKVTELFYFLELQYVCGQTIISLWHSLITFIEKCVSISFRVYRVTLEVYDFGTLYTYV